MGIVNSISFRFIEIWLVFSVLSFKRPALSFFFIPFAIVILCTYYHLALCDGRPNSPALEPRAPVSVPPEPPVPPVPIVPPEVPRLDLPLITDREHFIEQQQRFNLYYLGRNRITHLAEFTGRLERAVPIERNIEAALVFDGYEPDRIRGRINEIRGILFTHPTMVLLLSERTLGRELNEIQTNGMRQSAPYMRVVRAICNADLIL
ncbi:hypothetical protein Ddye_004737 [Dipteronia dyeriana]|uniref:Uncharacterized protein n=1 Tax=Dipteronia dyeriana TaxID=168575 RepID=A0AAD9XEY5_9ROSI|nr:hypothetical protein Ddye_004737 [Dipteronia dyeriana]